MLKGPSTCSIQSATAPSLLFHPSRPLCPLVEHFQHDDLDQTRNEIRLVRVSQDLYGNVECEVETCGLQTCPEYEALSYTWGSTTRDRTILMNERRFDIGKNLFDFLSLVAERSILLLGKDGETFAGRRTDLLEGVGETVAPEYLWIDQLCINQASTSDKSHQVAMMGDIFKRARRVIAWLGRGDATSNIAMLTLAEDLGRSTLEIESRLKQAWLPILQLLSRPYWSRLWIVQEFLLARDLIIVCGHYALPWTQLKTAANAMGSARLRDPIADAMIPLVFQRMGILQYELNVEREYPYRIISVGSAQYELLRLLNMYGWKECTDPRDKVYGLLGLLLTTTRDELSLTVDYSKDAATLFDEVFNFYEVPYWSNAHWIRAIGLAMGVKEDQHKAVMVWTSSVDR